MYKVQVNQEDGSRRTFKCRRYEYDPGVRARTVRLHVVDEWCVNSAHLYVRGYWASYDIVIITDAVYVAIKEISE